jgi:hypothetical protein
MAMNPAIPLITLFIITFIVLFFTIFRIKYIIQEGIDMYEFRNYF